MNEIDLRRFLRNRVHYYASVRDSHCVGVHDGCRLTEPWFSYNYSLLPREAVSPNHFARQ